MMSINRTSICTKVTSNKRSGDTDSIPESGRYSGQVNGNPLQYSCLGNRRDREAWQAAVPGAAKSRTWVSDEAQQHSCCCC